MSHNPIIIDAMLRVASATAARRFSNLQATVLVHSRVGPRCAARLQLLAAGYCRKTQKEVVGDGGVVEVVA